MSSEQWAGGRGAISCPRFVLGNSQGKPGSTADPRLTVFSLVPLSDRIRAAVVFGSMARGELKAGSDIDLMVVGEVELSEVLEALRPAEAELGREINAVVYLPEEYRRRRREKRHLVEAVFRGPRLAILGDLTDA